jgi:outer membrane murein-binding lipoprotein Lpp
MLSPFQSFVVRELKALNEKVDRMSLNLDALTAIVTKLLTDVPSSVSNAEAAAQAKIDALTAQLTTLDAQINPPAPPSAAQPTG